MESGKFVISLDFELMWGVRDKETKSSYGQNIAGVHKVIPRLLKLFHTYNINATFATVGFLFFRNKQELLSNIPAIPPDYENRNLSPYNNNYMERIGNNEYEDPYHFCFELINTIKQYPEQEIGTHTYSHYYCLEKGQTIDSFKEDIEHAVQIAQENGIAITSLVFPRNQFNDRYLKVCSDLGIICYRGNECSWLYAARSGARETLYRRSLRLMDAYINLSGHNCYSEEDISQSYPLNIPSSRFLRPYSPGLKHLEKLRLNRILSGMTHAAKNKLVYHLWWHPHNFGIHQEENFSFLEKIVFHYQKLNKKYNFKSIAMSGLAKQIINEQ